jgi:quercetin dioxygenase-like cupin family protein
MRNKPVAFKYVPEVSENAVFLSENPQPQPIYAEGQIKILTTGLELGQKIPVHPEGLAVYIFLKGDGWMVVNDERLQVEPGSMVITLAGAQRGIEAKSRLIFMAIRIFTGSA